MMRDVESILRDPLAEARSSGEAVGYVGLDFPQDLSFALDVPCVHLPWEADRETAFADAWLESSFPGWSRSILEDWAAGKFDALRSVIFSRGDDASQRLYYYVRELQRRGRLAGPQPLILDVARIPRETSVRHTRAALAQLALQLGVDAGAWRRGIERTNALRAAFTAIASRRSGNGGSCHRLARASLFGDVTHCLPEGPVDRPSQPRVLLAGSAPPDERLHDAVAEAGGDIIAESHGYGFSRLGPHIDAHRGDPVDAVARNFREAAGPRSFAQPAQRFEAALTEARADVAVLWLTREDEAFAWHVPAIRQRASEWAIPLLVLAARRWNADDGAIGEIQAFVERNRK